MKIPKRRVLIGCRNEVIIMKLRDPRKKKVGLPDVAQLNNNPALRI